MQNLESTQDYRSHTINIYYDEGNENPFDGWDEGLADLSFEGERGHSQQYGECPKKHIHSVITDGQAIRHQRAICDIIGEDIEYINERSESKEDKAEHIRDLIYDFDLEQLSELYDLMKEPHVYETQSYSRSEWADVFVFCSPEFMERTGVLPKNRQTACEGAAELFQQWASGEIFGYSIEDKEGNEIDSCGGFYGDDHKESGLIEYATNAIDCHINHVRKAKFAKLKELIKARVPYIYRVPQLAVFNI